MGDYPELGKATAAKIPNCQLVAFAGVGHVPHVEAFEKFIGTVLDFLSSAT
jgi:pimeloyl-ACP methyl ester carboxylesterase